MLKDNPLNPTPQSPHVSIEQGSNAYENTRKVLRSFDFSALKGKRVLLKPNVGRMAAFGSGVNTNPQVVAAAIDVFREHGAQVSIGESPITGVKTPEAFELAGITKIAQERNCPLIDLDARKPIPTKIPNGRVIHSLKICADIFDFDFIVSIPVMKIHMHTGVTLAVKNMKGCLWQRSKVDLHMLPQLPDTTDKSLDLAISDMATILLPHFSIIDGSIGMEGLGPGVGTPKKLDVILASPDAFAADAVACKLMGYDANRIPHLRLGAEQGCGTIDLSKINITPNNWQDYASNFEAAPKNLSFEFPNIEVLDKNSCSACQSTLLLFLKRFGHTLTDYMHTDAPLRIAIGKGHETIEKGTLCIGQCTVKQKGNGIFVPGCPPVGSQIHKVLQQHKGGKDAPYSENE